MIQGSENRLNLLFAAVGDADAILILSHNDPDPDAIASAVALRYLLAQRLDVEAHVVYQGIIGRAENKALVRYLGQPFRRLAASDLRRSDCIALVDAQPGAGNVTLPSKSSVAIVIDHHPRRDTTATAAFADVRPEVGATSTILTGYLQAAGVKLLPQIATALFYGIKTDTMGLIRSTSPADAAAFCYLQSQVDMEALSIIEHAQVPADYFKSFVVTLQSARVYKNVVIAYLGPVDYPDLAAEMADILLRLRRIRWVVCMSICKDLLIVSARTRNQQGAGQLVQRIIGNRGTAGGHGTMAGGQISLRDEDPKQLASQLSPRVLQHLKISSEVVGKPLL